MKSIGIREYFSVPSAGMHSAFLRRTRIMFIDAHHRLSPLQIQGHVPFQEQLSPGRRIESAAGGKLLFLSVFTCRVGYLFLVLMTIFFPGGDAAPDMPLGLVDLQHMPDPPVQLGIDRL